MAVSSYWFEYRCTLQTGTAAFTSDPSDDLPAHEVLLYQNLAGLTSDEIYNTAANSVAENSAIGTTVGITARAEDLDATDTVSYVLDDDAGGRFAIDATTGVVTVAGEIDYETATSHTIVVRATSSDSSTVVRPFTIAIADEVEGDSRGEGEAGANMLVAATSAGSRLATDLLMAEAATDLRTDDFDLDSLPSDADYAQLVDEIVADLFGEPSLP